MNCFESKRALSFQPKCITLLMVGCISIPFAARADSSAKVKTSIKQASAVPAQVAAEQSPAKPDAPADLSAKLYAIGKTNEAPMFFQKTHYTLDEDGSLHADTVMTDAAGKVVFTEKAHTKGLTLIDVVTEQYQKNVHYEMTTQNDHVYFKHGDMPFKPGDHLKENSEGLFDDFLAGPTSEAFFGAHWDELMSGKAVQCRFAVNELHETVKFEFKKKGEEKMNGVESVHLQLKPANPIIALLVDPIEVYIDKKEKRYVRFVGRTPLYTFPKGDSNAFDSDILYERAVTGNRSAHD